MTAARSEFSWEATAWPDLRDRLHSGPSAPTAQEVGLVPVGATEQHGPHLPTGTDTMIATAICHRAAATCAAPVLPAIAVGVSYGHGTQLPGTLSLTPTLLAAIVQQYAVWAAASGLQRLIFVNAHLGNTATLGTATDHLRLYAPQLRVAAVDWWDLDGVVRAEVLADGEDIHANRAETSLMLAIAPDLVHSERLADADDADRTAGLVFRYTAPSLSRNGVTGRPSQASAELGEKLLSLTAAALADLVVRGRTEQPPLGVASRPDL